MVKEEDEQVVPPVISEVLGARNLRMHSNVEELMDNYFALRVQPFGWDSGMYGHRYDQLNRVDRCLQLQMSNRTVVD